MTRPPVEIEVWVCARPGASHLNLATAALACAGAVSRVATAPAGEGAAGARNEALARCESEIVALVDDDVEVLPGWLDALRAVWSTADADALGCAGGPLGARFIGGRPGWLSDALLQGLGVDDPEWPVAPAPAAPRAVHRPVLSASTPA
jgi:glycosyltransferase involved in cell wall biosynthesis